MRVQFFLSFLGSRLKKFYNINKAVGNKGKKPSIALQNVLAMITSLSLY